MMGLMGFDYTLLADISDTFDSPNTGEFKIYPGGTSLEDASDAINAKATVSLQKFSTLKTMGLISKEWEQKTAVVTPIGIRNTDRFLEEISALTGASIPQELEDERGRV